MSESFAENVSYRDGKNAYPANRFIPDLPISSVCWEGSLLRAPVAGVGL